MTDTEQNNPTDSPENGETPRRRILIGSQRDPAAYKADRRRDWEPIAKPEPEPEEKSQPAAASEKPPVVPDKNKKPSPQEAALAEAAAKLDAPAGGTPVGRIPPPNVRDELPADLEEEFNQAIGEVSFDELLTAGDPITRQVAIEENSWQTGCVVTVRQDDVFIELGSREQGVISTKQFEQLPKPGDSLEVIVQRFNADEGLYELTLPNAVAAVADWDDLNEGMVVNARITGHNTGGLECEVGGLRGFIPAGQVSLYHVDDLAQFVGEKFTCVVTEANPARRNLVLSRRAVLEREKEEARERLIQSLQPGQIHDGVVRKLMDFGAFVDIGGIDGLLHVSQLAWHRVEHPSEVLSEGQTIRVKIEKIDRTTGKLSLAYRDMLESPWQNAEKNYPQGSVVKGTVSKLMEFGAFVELERGVEGLVHISELSHRRVWRSSDVVAEGDEIEVLVLSVDPDAQRISLSMKELSTPEPVKKDKEPEVGELPNGKKSSRRKKPSQPLKGGLGKSAGGEHLGLKW